MMEFAFILFGIALAMYGSYRWLLRRDAMVTCYDHSMQEFIEASEALLSDDDTPPAIVVLIQFMRQRAADPASARHFLKHVLLRRKQIAQTPRVLDIEQLEVRRPELSRALATACSAAFLAITYNSFFVGPVMRKLVLFDASERKDRTKQLAESYREIEAADQGDPRLAAA